MMQLDNVPGYDDVMIRGTWDLVAVNLTIFNIIFADYISLCVYDAASNIPGYNDVMIGGTWYLVAVNLTVFNIIFTDNISL